jgi:hypothetical protein
MNLQKQTLGKKIDIASPKNYFNNFFKNQFLVKYGHSPLQTKNDK